MTLVEWPGFSAQTAPGGPEKASAALSEAWVDWVDGLVGSDGLSVGGLVGCFVKIQVEVLVIQGVGIALT